MERAVARGLKLREEMPMPHLAADEKSYRKGRNFVTVLMGLGRGSIHGTASGNIHESLEFLLKALTKPQRQSVDAIALDRHDPYRLAVESVFLVPAPDIVHDRFHIVAHMHPYAMLGRT